MTPAEIEKLNDPSWYFDALKGIRGDIHADEPKRGFYQSKRKDGTMDAVAYWYDLNNGRVRCHVNGKDMGDELRALEMWPFASKRPVSEADYRARLGTGKWPNEHDGVVRDTRNANAAPPDNSFEALQDRILDLKRDADKLIAKGAAKTRDEADAASDLATRLAALQKNADEARAAEKKPHDDRAKEVQALWKPLIEHADIYKVLKRIVATPWLIAEDNRIKAEQAAADKAARDADAKGETAIAQPIQQTAKAGAQRTVSLRTVYSAEIVDRAKVLAFFAESEEITAVLQSLADKAARAKIPVPGVKIIETQSAV